MKTILTIALLLPIYCLSQQIVIVPEPAKMEIGKGNFILNKNTVIVSNDATEKPAIDLLNSVLKQRFGFKLKQVKKATKNFISVYTKRFIMPGKEGKYDLTIRKNSVQLSGDTYSGTYYAMQTLLQLLPDSKQQTVNYKLPVITINDEPRFQYRGMHLDCARHFFTVEQVKKYIDYLASYKLNYFHWHLTEDQGWRIEIKKYPKLIEVGGCRNGTIIGHYPGTGNDNIKYCGYYTQEQIKEVVKYAQERYITIIPEIEMPGHSEAALTAYPFLGCTNGPYEVQQTWGVFDDVFCAGNDSTFNFLQDVLDEVIELFPSKIIHIGGDESPKTRWKVCSKCRQRIKDNNLKDEHELQSYFIQRIEKYLNSKGRTIIGWDEILEGGLAPNAMVMSWRGEAGGIAAANQNHYVVMTPDSHLYFDRSQTMNEDSVVFGSYVPLEKVYNYEPVSDKIDSTHQKYILGAQANLWTEYISNQRKIEYMIFPRMAALSEVTWTPKEKRNWDTFQKKIPVIFSRYDLAKTNYSKAYYDLSSTVLQDDFYHGIVWKLDSKLRGSDIQIRNTSSFDDDGNKIYSDYTHPVNISTSGLYEARQLYNSKQAGNSIFQRFIFSKSTGQIIRLATPPSEKYPGNGGAFGLVNGARSEKGFTSSEWLGWYGNDMSASIFTGNADVVSSVVVHTLKQEDSWIHLPEYVEVFISDDNINFTSVGRSSQFVADSLNMGTIRIAFPVTHTRYVKVLAVSKKNIEAGKPGAGSAAWVFVDEIEVN